jgi:DNA modification methylase
LGYDINQEYIDISEKRIAEYNNPKWSHFPL